MMRELLSCPGKPSACIFMSGSGTNAAKLLEYASNTWDVSVIVTDAPLKSRAREIAAKYNLPLVELDIAEFYRERGEPRVSLMTENGRKIRGEWTNALRKKLETYKIDFGILAGFVPLSNITGDFPCLNVHPGDLTYEKDGKRFLVGLHTVPIERAILEGHSHLRSSVIIAQPYTGAGGEMDSGPIIGISPAVPVDMMGFTPDVLRKISEARPARRPPGGFADNLEKVAEHNQQLLKENGDWVVFPRAVEDFAMKKFAVDGDGSLLYRSGPSWKKIKTIVYSTDSSELISP